MRKFISFFTFSFFMFAFVLGSAAAEALGSAYGDDCKNYSWGSKESVAELREFKLLASGRISVDAGKNGGISVKGGDVGEVQLRACVTASGDSAAEAQGVLSSIRVNTSGTISAEGPADGKGWAVSFSLIVPRNTDLELKAKNGGIAISGVESNVEFETVNGGVALSNLGGNVRGRTTNGGVSIKLEGQMWRGNGLDVLTTNGGVSLKLPATYAANIETGTVNGGFRSDIPELNVTTEDVRGDWSRGSRAKQINTSINGGGPMIRVKTTNGGIKISSAEEIKY
ncbi:MAG: hypothetical protein IPM21_10050 [Acidobacteria bacterium]|nr:hypothetical protein [Acidobacteriota bacterium]